MEPPSVNETYVVSITLDCLIGISNAINRISETEQGKSVSIIYRKIKKIKKIICFMIIN